jgi:hypothetical protein
MSITPASGTAPGARVRFNRRGDAIDGKIHGFFTEPAVDSPSEAMCGRFVQVNTIWTDGSWKTLVRQGQTCKRCAVLAPMVTWADEKGKL